MDLSSCVVCMERFPIGQDQGISCLLQHFICCYDLNSYLSENVLSQLFKLRESRGRVSCPHPECNEFYDSVELFERMGRPERLRYVSILDDIVSNNESLRRLKSAVNDVITLVCPSCNTTIDPYPDACSAVLCLNCGNHYCNFCFQAFASVDSARNSADCHTHCATHSVAESAEQRDAFLPLEVVKTGHRQYQLRRLTRLLSLALSSPEHGVNGGQDVAVILMLSQPSIIELQLGSASDIWRSVCGSLLPTAAVAGDGRGAVGLAPISTATTQLSNAIKTMNSEAALQILAVFPDEVDVNYCHEGIALVSSAEVNDMTAVVLRLLELGADPWQFSHQGRSLLFIVAERGDAVVLDAILDANINLNINAPVTSEADRSTMFHIAARCNRGNILSRLLASDVLVRANLEQAEESFGYTPLCIACMKGSDYALSVLLQHGASIHVMPPNGRSPLFYSVECGKTEAARMLIARSRDQLAPVDDGVPYIDRVVEPSTGRTALHIAILCEKITSVLLLVELGADLTVKSGMQDQCSSPFLFALLCGFLSAAELLLQRGADITTPLFNGRTPLYVAVERGFTSIVSAMIERGVDINSPCSRNGKAALHTALLYKRESVVSLLLAAGADADSPGWDLEAAGHETMLELAVKMGCESSVHLILQRQVRYRPATQFGSALSFAVERRNTSIVRLLLQHFNLDINAPVIASAALAVPALHQAILGDDVNMVHMLVRLGADTGMRVDGLDAYEFACRHGSKNVSRLLLEVMQNR